MLESSLRVSVRQYTEEVEGKTNRRAGPKTTWGSITSVITGDTII